MVSYMPSVVVIGGGLSGLASAALLSKRGMKVTIIEKNNVLGGRARYWKNKGFFYDMGPSWYLMPEVFENFFKKFGKKSTDFYKLKKLDPAYRVFYEKEGIVDVPAEKKEVLKLFEKMEKGSAKKLEKYLANAKFKYDTAMQRFLYKDYKNITDFFTPEMVSAGLKLQLFESLDKYVSKSFNDHKLKKLLEYSMVFLGGSPKNTPALYSLMSHVDLNLGVYYPLGGLYEIVKAMEIICKENGVNIIKGKTVKKIVVEQGKAKKVILNNKKSIEADIVLSNADYEFSETKLLDESQQSYKNNYWENTIMGPSALIFYLGVKKKIKKLKHHNLFLANNWNAHFESIFEKKSWPKNPSYYVSCPSKSDTSVAPKGKENLFFLVPVASGLKDNKQTRKKMFNQIINNFEERIGENIKEQIIVKRIFAHKDFIDDYNAYRGTALGLAHTLWQTAIFRPAHKSKKVKNLYYSGSYTHPGIGVPMVIISAQIVTNEILKDYGQLV